MSKSEREIGAEFAVSFQIVFGREIHLHGVAINQLSASRGLEYYVTVICPL
jgi:hypothetical protein